MFKTVCSDEMLHSVQPVEASSDEIQHTEVVNLDEILHSVLPADANSDETLDLALDTEANTSDEMLHSVLLEFLEEDPKWIAMEL